MKHLKTYESHRKSFYKNGDIVLVNSITNNINNELMRIVLSFNAKENYYAAELYYEPEGENFTIFEKDILKKLEPHEIDDTK